MSSGRCRKGRTQLAGGFLALAGGAVFATAAFGQPGFSGSMPGPGMPGQGMQEWMDAGRPQARTAPAPAPAPAKADRFARLREASARPLKAANRTAPAAQVPSKPSWVAVAQPGFSGSMPGPGMQEQGLQDRMDSARGQATTSPAPAKPDRFARLREASARPLLAAKRTDAAARVSGKPSWVAAAQTIPAPAPQASLPQASPASPATLMLTETARRRKALTVYTDLQFGYDKQQVLIATPAPFLSNVRRQVRSLVVTAQYPFSRKTNISLSVPYISQTIRATTPVGRFRQSGNGVGDIGLFVERRFPEIARGTEASLTAGMLFPTGKDPYGLGVNQLPTGLGFYQPMVRARLSKMRVPMNFYGAVDYGTSLSRNLNGNRVKLPVSYGAELGFYYAVSPEFTTQTAVKWSRLSSPFTFETDSTVAYLSQALIYSAGADTSIQAAVDAGLTEDALDVFLTLSMVKRF